MFVKSVRSLRLLALSFTMSALLTSCYQAHSDDDLRTVPVTNNPHIVPGGGSPNLTAFGY